MLRKYISTSSYCNSKFYCFTSTTLTSPTAAIECDCALFLASTDSKRNIVMSDRIFAYTSWDFFGILIRTNESRGMVFSSDCLVFRAFVLHVDSCDLSILRKCMVGV